MVMLPIIAASAVALAVGMVALVALVPSRRVRLVDAMSDDGPSAVPVDRPGAAGAMERTLQRIGVADRAQELLLGAAVSLPLGQFAVRVVGAAVVVAFVTAIAVGPLAALMFAAATVGASVVELRRRRAKRAKQFAEQLSSTLRTVVSSLRAGYSLPQALEAVAQAGFDPTSAEFERMLGEVRVGVSVAEALGNLGARMHNADFSWVVIAIDINSEVGGNLSEVLETVERTLRERESLRRNVLTLSAEGRMSAKMIFALPFVVLGLISFLNPEYVQIYANDPAGVIMASVAGVLMVLGGLWLRKVVRIQL
jgi:tight adherence protein B